MDRKQKLLIHKKNKKKMTFDHIIAIIEKLSTFFLAVLTIYINYKINKMHKQFNSRMDQTIKLVEDKAHREGKAEEKAENEAAKITK